MPKRIYKKSKEHREKLSKIFRVIAKEKGYGLWMKGKKLSEETKRKISLALIGRKLSKEHRKKISEFQTGAKSHFFGKRHTEETKRKIGLAQKGKHYYWKGKKRSPFSDEWRRNISEAKRGEKNWNWRGGITLLVDLIRSSSKYRQWRSDVFTRDNFICVLCSGSKGGNLEADHYPKMFSTIFHEYKIKTLEEALMCEEFWNINNGRTLCISCHKKTKNYGRPKKS